ncbi:probable 4-coumarate--CoA ligase 1 [Culicoides brevitarsis]|uniref:probable 4-coumarate--CoA ligase 1 n=1 Tax=Culicoides brevitarsis TaxID=469753 RepID=UPI00307BA95C
MSVTFDAEKKIWYGPTKEYTYGNLGVAEVIFTFLKNNPEHVAQISDDTGKVYTSKAILKAAISFAQVLKAKNVGKNDNVLSLMDNHHYMMPAWLGVTFAGAVLCPFAMTDNSVKEEISDIVDQVQPKIFITSRLDLVDYFKSIFKNLNLDCPIYIYENTIDGCHDLKPLLEQDVDIDAFEVPKVENSAKDIVMLTLSSATTGKPKLINTTHMQVIAGLPTDFGKVIIASTNKPGWSAENNLAFGCLTQPYTRVITAKDQTIDEFLELIDRHKVNIVSIKPKDIYAAIRSPTIKTVDLSHLKMVGSSGQHLSTKIADEFQSYMTGGTVVNVYGTSDVGIAITQIVFGKTKPGSVGQINANVTLRIVSESGENLGVNEMGEIYVKCNVPFAGYYKNEKMTKEALDEEGFYRTADIGYVDAEGNVFLVDRKKFLISYGGEFLNQSEIEKIVLEHVKGVEAVCVVDVEHSEYNVIPIICIIPEKGVTLNEQEIIDTVHKNYNRKFYTKVFFVDDMPMTLSGKFKKYMVRDQILKMNNGKI